MPKVTLEAVKPPTAPVKIEKVPVPAPQPERHRIEAVLPRPEPADARPAPVAPREIRTQVATIRITEDRPQPVDVLGSIKQHAAQMRTAAYAIPRASARATAFAVRPTIDPDRTAYIDGIHAP
jgi:hypothetical protein